jgi:hypothetical protein
MGSRPGTTCWRWRIERGSFTPDQYGAIKAFLDAPEEWTPPAA